MAFALVMPKFGMTMKEARVVRWLRDVGDFVERDEPILIAENEKFTNEVGALAPGFLLQKIAEEGKSYPVGGLLAYLGEKDEKPVPGGEITSPAPEI